MARFKFIGQYTGAAETVRSCGVTFTGREPAEVTDAEAIRRLSHNPEFAEVAEQRPAPKKAAPKKPRAKKAKK